MKKKLLTLMMIFAVGLSTIGCGTETKVITANVENTGELNNNVFGMNALIKIGGGLYYDTMTHVVYWWNGYLDSNWATAPSPYYAPNGLPYKYNPETNTLEEIYFAVQYAGGSE